MNLILRETDFATVLPIWTNLLWPGRVSTIRPWSTMVYLGGKDQTIATGFGPQARFFSVTDQDGNKLVGVFSGHQTSATQYRARGLYVDPDYQGLGVGTLLVENVVNAAMTADCDLCWCIPRVPNMPFFQSCGFVQTSDPTTVDMEFGPNVYAARAILPF